MCNRNVPNTSTTSHLFIALMNCHSVTDNHISSSGVLQTYPIPWGNFDQDLAEDSGAATEASHFILNEWFFYIFNCGVTEFSFSEMSFDKMIKHALSILLLLEK